MIELIRQWQDLLGAGLGGVLGFLAALFVLHAERRTNRRMAMLQLAAMLRAYRSASVPLLHNILSTSASLKPGVSQVVAALRFAPAFPADFSQVSALLLPLDSELNTYLGRFTELAVFADAVRGHLNDNSRLLKEGKNTAAVQIQSEIEADLAAFRTAMEGANHEAQKIQRYLTRYFLYRGAVWRRAWRALNRPLWSRLPHGVVLTAEWDVVPADMETMVRKTSPESGGG